MNATKIKIGGIAASLIVLAGCSSSTPTPASGNPATSAPAAAPATNNQPGAVAAPAATAQKASPTTAAVAAPAAAPANIAARVNGTTISKQTLELELSRYIAGDPGAAPQDEASKKELSDFVLEGLIEQILIDQEAAKQRITISDKDINDELAMMAELRGGADQLKEWMTMAGVTEAELRQIAREELTASALRDKMSSQAPASAEYAHAFHILVNTEAEARQILTQLQGGAKFDALAKSKSLDVSTAPMGGDLDWFAQGTGAIIWEEVERAAFQLKAGQTSDVVKSSVGYHIIRVAARETRPLTAEDAAFLQQIVFETWLENQTQTGKIEKFN